MFDDPIFGETKYQMVDKILYNNSDITKELEAYHIYGKNEKGLRAELAKFFCSTEDQIKINSTVELKKISFAEEWF